MKTQVELKFFRPFRDLKNGGCVSLNMRVGVSSTGDVFLPAKVLGVPDDVAAQTVPRVIFEETIYVELDEAIRVLPCPAAKQCVRVLKQTLLKKVPR